MSTTEEKPTEPVCECEHEEDEEIVSDEDSVTTEDIYIPHRKPRVFIVMDLPPWFVAVSVYLFSLGIGMWKTRC